MHRRRWAQSLIGAFKGPSKFCKFAKIFCFEPQSMHMAGDIFEIVCIFLCNFKVERFHPLFIMMVIVFVIVGLVAASRWGAFSLNVK